jgi:glycosyltransferase involved in cell wall biosynthesis
MAHPVLISIIIATRDRETILWESVEKALNAIANNAVEIIIINDADKLLTPPGHLSGRIVCVNNPRRGVSAARNYGVSQSSGDILFFVDDDMWVNEAAIDWITDTFNNLNPRERVFNLNWEYPPVLQKQLSNSKVGRYLLSSDYHTMWGRMHQQGKQPASGIYEFPNVGSGSLVMLKEIFASIGGYNEVMIFQGEDIDLSQRLLSAGIKIFTVFSVTLFHNHQDRIGIDGYISRESNGYASEFKAVRAGLIKSSADHAYSGSHQFIYEFFRYSERFWLSVFKILPNHNVFNFITNRLVGILAGLQRYKHWRKASEM